MVKFIGFAGIILFIGLVFTIWGIMIDDYETNYINQSIVNASQVDNKYLNENLTKQTNELNDTFSPTYEAAKKVGNPDAGWFELFTGGALVIATGLSSLVTGIAQLFKIIGILFGTFSSLLSIPQSIMTIGLVGILIVIIIKLIGLIRKYEEA